jgi:predicted MPP superfamily phosphohydrolase
LLTRRRFLSRFLIGASAVAAIGSADALFLEPRNLVSEHIDIRLKRLQEEFRGFRIAQISDVHFGPYMGKSGLERALQLAQSFQPDLLALTGDFVSHPFGGSNGPRRAHYAEACADVLAAVKGFPVIAILGNHDHWNNAAIVEGALRRSRYPGVAQPLDSTAT